MSRSMKKTWVLIVVAVFAALGCFGLTKTMTASAETLRNDVLTNPAQVYSEENDDLGFTLVNGSGYKVRAVNKNLTAAVIPAEYNGLPVTEIAGNGFVSCKSLTSIYIPKTVKTIGSNAFYNCTALTRVYGASNLEAILSNAFYNYVSYGIIYRRPFCSQTVIACKIPFFDASCFYDPADLCGGEIPF